jgi:hypothetical protein
MGKSTVFIRASDGSSECFFVIQSIAATETMAFGSFFVWQAILLEAKVSEKSRTMENPGARPRRYRRCYSCRKCNCQCAFRSVSSEPTSATSAVLIDAHASALHPRLNWPTLYFACPEFQCSLLV